MVEQASKYERDKGQTTGREGRRGKRRTGIKGLAEGLRLNKRVPATGPATVSTQAPVPLSAPMPAPAAASTPAPTSGSSLASLPPPLYEPVLATFRRTCFKCGNLGHYADQCTATTRLCYNCKQLGHRLLECPETRGGANRQCYVCHQTGHLRTECPVYLAKAAPGDYPFRTPPMAFYPGPPVAYFPVPPMLPPGGAAPPAVFYPVFYSSPPND